MPAPENTAPENGATTITVSDWLEAVRTVLRGASPEQLGAALPNGNRLPPLQRESAGALPASARSRANAQRVVVSGATGDATLREGVEALEFSTSRSGVAKLPELLDSAGDCDILLRPGRFFYAASAALLARSAPPTAGTLGVDPILTALTEPLFAPLNEEVAASVIVAQMAHEMATRGR